jgi:hypothetical protein
MPRTSHISGLETVAVGGGEKGHSSWQGKCGRRGKTENGESMMKKMRRK